MSEIMNGFCNNCNRITTHQLEDGSWWCRECDCNNILSKMPMENKIDHPSHYTKHPSGIECIEIVKHMNFCCGNAIKYIWRADLKGNDIEDLQKAKKNIDFEIQRRKENEKKL